MPVVQVSNAINLAIFNRDLGVISSPRRCAAKLADHAVFRPAANGDPPTADRKPSSRKLTPAFLVSVIKRISPKAAGCKSAHHAASA